MLSMTGTALVINEENKVTVFEGVLEKNVDKLKDEELTNTTNPEISVIFHEDVIDWEYGY